MIQFSDQIIAIIDDLCRRFGIAIDWSQKNVAPYLEDLCGRYISYEVATSITHCLIWVLITSFLLAVVVFLRKPAKECACSDYNFTIHDLWVALCWIALVVGVISFVVICVQIFDIIACMTIPEKVLVEYVMSIME